jgi:hypothetical protein
MIFNDISESTDQYSIYCIHVQYVLAIAYIYSYVYVYSVYVLLICVFMIHVQYTHQYTCFRVTWPVHRIYLSLRLYTAYDRSRMNRNVHSSRHLMLPHSMLRIVVEL